MNIVGLFEKDIFLVKNGYISMFLSEMYKFRNRIIDPIINIRINRIIDYTLNGKFDEVYHMLREWQREYVNNGHGFDRISAASRDDYVEWNLKNRQLSLL